MQSLSVSSRFFGVEEDGGQPIVAAAFETDLVDAGAGNNTLRCVLRG